MNYQEKYLKYKQKYIDLQKLIGGSKDSALKYFLSKFKNNDKNKDTYTKILSILQKDYDKGILKIDLASLNTDPPTLTSSEIFEQIFICVEQDTKNIDWIIKSYINDTFGEPSSLENYGRFKDAMEKYTILNNNKKIISEFKGINDINGLIELENYISENKNNLKVIEEKNNKKNKKSTEMKKIKEEGEDDVVIVYETDKSIVYNPTTEDGARYYGRGTRWCTAAKNNSMFTYYDRMGPLFIIQSKINPDIKFQIHLPSKQLMDDKDNEVTFNIMTNRLDDYTYNNFNNYYLKEFKNKGYLIINIKLIQFITTITKINPENNKYHKNLFSSIEIIYSDNPESTYFAFIPDKNKDYLIIDYLDIDAFLDYYSTKINYYFIVTNNLYKLYLLNPNTKYVILGNTFNEPLGHSLSNLVNLKTLFLPVKYDSALIDTSTNIKSIEINSFHQLELLPEHLEDLTFANNINQELGSSLDNLINLKYLTLGNDFDKPLGDSLKSLTNLKSLKFENLFDQNLSDSLYTLTKLESLTFGEYFHVNYSQSDNPFYYLTNLKSLTIFSNFIYSLGNSLSTLTKLKYLNLGDIRGELGNSLDSLVNLEYLKIFRLTKIGDSFKNLTNLKSLTIGKLNTPVGDSLKYLIKLEHLSIPKNNIDHVTESWNISEPTPEVSLGPKPEVTDSW